jgi:hypothetical protein
MISTIELLRTFLITAPLPTNVTAGSVFVTEPTEDDTKFPAKSVFLWTSVFQAPPIPHLGTASTSLRSIVNVRVRGSQGGEKEALQRARAVMAKLHRGDVTGLVGVTLRESEPMHLGLDTAKRVSYQFSLNVLGVYTAP